MISSNSTTQLKELVRSVRLCKTANEERTLVARECANLRNIFKNENSDTRCVAVTKLLYFYILGYPAHFGQMECLKLIASPRFVDKRIGYLGCMMMLDELTDVHVLVTNCLKNDLSHSSQHVQGLALCTLASICSSDMAEMLAKEVEKIIRTSSSYLKKKAALCASRIVTKAPEVAKIFIPCLKTVLKDSNVGVQLCGCTLAITLCEEDASVIESIKSFDVVPHLIRVLKSLINVGSALEHTVHGVGNPFLQVKILRLLSYCGRNDDKISASLNDLLAQAITNTEVRKNAGNAVLYEAVLTIFSIQSSKDLRVLAINLLGKFLQFPDKNTKYIAISTMQRVIQYDFIPLLRHRDYIFKCSTDEDISIKRRSIELLFSLITKENMPETIKHLIDSMPSCSSALKQYITSNIITALEKYDVDKRWQVETFINLLESAGAHIQDHAVSNFVSLVSNTSAIQPYVVIKLYEILQKGFCKPIVSNAACWCIGEYGAEVFSNNQYSSQIDPNKVVCLISSLLKSTLIPSTTKHIALYSLAKLSVRFPSLKSQILPIIRSYTSYIDTEIQQRSVEYIEMADSSFAYCEAIFESMPPLIVKSIPTSFLENAQAPSITKKETKQEESLLDLLGTDLTDSFTSNTNDLASCPSHKIQVYDKNGIIGFLEFSNPLPGGMLGMTFHAQNSNLFIVSQFTMQAAVPKNLLISLKAPSGTEILPSFYNEITQTFIITNTNKVPLKLRLRLTYQIQGTPFEDIVEVNNLPSLIFP